MRARHAAALLAVAAIAAIAAGATHAFPRICDGTACHGSATDSIPEADVCVPGITTYWEDSYLPANAQAPHLTHWSVTPKPPCSGADVSAPKPDSFPASLLDPDGSAVKPKAGEAVFRVRWTVDVPDGSAGNGPMVINWAIAWTQAAGATETISTPAAHPKYDLAAAVRLADHFDGTKPQDVRAQLVITNNGPAASPANVTVNVDNLWVVGAGHGTQLTVKAPKATGCGQSYGEHMRCTLGALAPHAKRVLTYAIVWQAKEAALMQKAEANGHPVFLEVHVEANVTHDSSGITHEHCRTEETTCANNTARAESTPH